VRLTLGNVLDQQEFGLTLRTAPDDARGRAVDGAHAIDLPDAAQWLHEGWIMLSTGIQFHDDPAAQVRLISQLADAEITALGLGMGIVLDAVPPAMLEEAERRGFPIFTSPLEVPFREIVLFINRSVLSSDLYVLQRLNSMQRYLLDALHQQNPESVLIERLASLLGGAEVSYLDLAGEPIATTRGAFRPPPGSLEGGSTSLREFEHDGHQCIAVPVLKGQASLGWLAVQHSTMTVSGYVARPVVRTTAELLGLVSVMRLSATRDRRQWRDRLGDRLLRTLAGEEDAGLTADLATEGLDFVAPCRVAVLRHRPTVAAPEPETAPCAMALTDALEALDLDFIVGFDAGEIVVLAQGDLGELEAVLGGDPRLAGFRAGLSEPLDRLDDLAERVEQGRLVLNVGPIRPEVSVQSYAELDPSVILLGADCTQPLLERLERVLEPLEREPRLLEAVIAYFESGFDVSRAGSTLGLHRNSVRYRLDRAEAALGRSLRSPDTVTAIYLARLAQARRLSAAGEQPR